MTLFPGASCMNNVGNGKKKAWRTYLLFIPLQEALALPNPVRMNNVRAHADMMYSSHTSHSLMHTAHECMNAQECEQSHPEDIYRCLSLTGFEICEIS